MAIQAGNDRVEGILPAESVVNGPEQIHVALEGWQLNLRRQHVGDIVARLRRVEDERTVGRAKEGVIHMVCALVAMALLGVDPECRAQRRT